MLCGSQLKQVVQFVVSMYTVCCYKCLECDNELLY